MHVAFKFPNDKAEDGAELIYIGSSLDELQAAADSVPLGIRVERVVLHRHQFVRVKRPTPVAPKVPTESEEEPGAPEQPEAPEQPSKVPSKRKR